MPLPDERPRQSVANLIGRFENQVKRQPSSSPASSRSLSAISHNSDSAKEDLKERREWPPRSVSPESRPPVVIPSSSFAKNLALAQAASEVTQEPDAAADPSLTPRPNSASSNADKPKPIVTLPERQLSIGVTAPTPTSPNTPTTAKPPVTAKPPPAKTPVKPSASKPATTRIPPKSTGPRASTASTAQTPAAQSLKPQNTGPGSTSTSVRKPTVPKSTPATPISRAKTPVRTALAPPTRPKTPSSVRAKTPSTGLFAPTAASLAKSRNAPPVPPTPAKKITLSSSASDRLSKPTAASLSRARSPLTTARAASMKPTPSTGRTAATNLKPRASAAGAGNGNGTNAKNAEPSASARAAMAAAMAAAGMSNTNAAAAEEAPSEEPGAPSEEENGHLPEEKNDENHSEDAVDSKEPLGVENGDHEPSNGDAVEVHSETDAHPVVVEPEPKFDSESHEQEVDAVKSRPRAGNDIEDIVNLLESTSISQPRPLSIVSIPDEVSEIPDEE